MKLQMIPFNANILEKNYYKNPEVYSRARSHQCVKWSKRVRFYRSHSDF